MDGHALVQLQGAIAVLLLDHPDVLLLGLALPKHALALGRTDRPHRDGDHRRERDRNDEVAPAEPGRRHQSESDREHEEGPLGTEQRDEDERREHRPQQRARGRDRVQAARDGAGVLDVGHREADRPGRGGPEHHHRDRDQEEHPDQGTDEGAG